MKYLHMHNPAEYVEGDGNKTKQTHIILSDLTPAVSSDCGSDEN